MATEGADGISHDQVFFGDPLILPARPALVTEEMKAERDRFRSRLAELEQRLKSLPGPARVYGVVSETAPAVHVQFRGDPEQPRGRRCACCSALGCRSAACSDTRGQRGG